MHPPARFKWRKEVGRFAAYPLGIHHPKFAVTIAPNVGQHQSWVWRVSWPRWFEGLVYADDKQAAADAATEVEQRRHRSATRHRKQSDPDRGSRDGSSAAEQPLCRGQRIPHALGHHCPAAV